MKIFFFKDDSLYKIFRTFQKIPLGKKAEVYIETGSPFFVHERWGKQIKELIEKEHLDVVFVTESPAVRKYYKDLGLPVKYVRESGIMKLLRLLYLFFFNIKKFHLYLYTTKKNYAFYLVFFFELLVVLGIFYVLYNIVVPKTIISIRPSYTIEDVVYNFRYYPEHWSDFPTYINQFSIPYKTGTVTLSHTVSIPLTDVLYESLPAKGVVRIVNETFETIPLRSGTRLTTDDGLVFFTDNFILIPPATSSSPGFTFVTVTAGGYDANGRIMGERGNISKDTRLWIFNLPQSRHAKQVYADAVYDFVGGKTVRKHVVSSGDITNLRQHLEEYMQKNKVSLIKAHVQDEKNIVLPFPDLFIPLRSEFFYSLPPFLTGNGIISGTLIQEYLYYYTTKKDILLGFDSFLRERQSIAQTIISFQTESLAFLDRIPSQKTGVFIIPTKISLIQSYNFLQDPNYLLPEFKEKLVGVDLQEAKQYLLEYPAVGTVSIDVFPPWYRTVAKLKSRIFFRIEE